MCVLIQTFSPKSVKQIYSPDFFLSDPVVSLSSTIFVNGEMSEKI